jgi:hypothetical protein
MLLFGNLLYFCTLFTQILYIRNYYIINELVKKHADALKPGLHFIEVPAGNWVIEISCFRRTYLIFFSK